MKIFSQLMLMVLALLAFCSSAYSQVPQNCIDRFTNGGAVPNTETCFIDAITSSAGLSNFGCTANQEVALEFCGLIDEEETERCPDGRFPDFDTLECPPVERPALENYDPENDDQPCPAPFESLPNLPGPVQFVTQGLDYHPSPVLSNLSLVTSGITGINLVNAVENARETGDTDALADNVAGIALPLLSFTDVFREIFQMFFSFGQAQSEVCE